MLQYLKYPVWTLWRFVVDFRSAARNTAIVLAAFGLTILIGSRVVRVLHKQGRGWSVRTRGRFVWRVARRVWARRVLERAGIRVAVVGQGRVDWTRPHVVVANHQSTLDIVVVAAALPDGRYVAKKEILAYPFVGAACRDGGQILIDRSNHGQSMSAIREGMRNWPDCNLLFFAEGRRTQTGVLGEFKKGAFAIAKETGLPIVPVAIDGTFAALPKGSLLRLRRNPVVRVEIGRPIAAEGDVPELARRVREVIRAMIEGPPATTQPRTRPVCPPDGVPNQLSS